MGIKIDQFSIKIYDVSEFNGIIDWSKVKASGVNAIGIRVGYGANLDKNFIANAEGALAAGLKVFFYWYSDYYSYWYNKKHSAYGLSDSTWGRKQADLFYSLAKKYGITIVFLDVENITYADWPKLTDPTAKEHAQTINKAFLERMDELNVTCGIYASLGWLS